MTRGALAFLLSVTLAGCGGAQRGETTSCMADAREDYQAPCRLGDLASCNQLAGEYLDCAHGKRRKLYRDRAIALYRATCAKASGEGCRLLGEVTRRPEAFARACDLGERVVCSPSHPEPEPPPPFTDQLAPYAMSMWRLLAVQVSLGDPRRSRPRSYLDDVLAAAAPSLAKETMDDLAAVEALCNEQQPQAGRTLPDVARDPWRYLRAAHPRELPEGRDPDVWCYIARQRRELMTAALARKSFLPEHDRAAFDDPIARTGMKPEIVQVLTDPSTLVRAVTAEAERWYSAAGLPMPATPTAQFEEQVDQLRRTIQYRLGETRISSGRHDLRVEALARAQVVAGEPGVRVLASAMDDGGFAVVTDDHDAPTQRWCTGRVLLRRPRTSWCEERWFSYVEPHAGGGRFRPTTLVRLLDMTDLVRCPGTTAAASAGPR